MAVTIENLATAELTTSTVAIVTAPSNARVRITHCNVVNYSGGAVTYSAWRVNSGGSAVNANKVTSLKSVATNASDQAPEITGQILEAGDAIHMAASANTALVVTMSGQQIT